jgi:FkbM family methyltransferase
MNKIILTLIKSINDIGLILRDNVFPNKFKLLLVYLNITTIYYFSRILRTKINNITIFNYKINIYDFGDFYYMFREIFIEKLYYYHTLIKAPFIIDCGANIGIATLFFKTIYPKSKVIAFEPSKKSYPLLKNNIIVNNLLDVEPINKAVADYEGKLILYSDIFNTGLGNTSFYEYIAICDKNNQNIVSESVDTTLLSKYINGDVDFLKLNVEGSEILVIEELRKQGKLRFIKNMVFLYHHHVNIEEDNLSNVLSILENNNFGYKLTTLVTDRFISINNIPGDRQYIYIYAYQKIKAL